MRGLLLTLVLAIAVGCGPKPASTSSTPVGPPPSKTAEKPSTPEETVHEQLRSGLYQLRASLGTIEKARAAVRMALGSASGDTKAALQDVLDRIDSVGGTLTNYDGDPPALEDVKKSFSTYDEKRLKMVDDVNDALTELKETAGIVGDMTDQAKSPLKEKVDALADGIDAAIDDVRGTLQALGGKEQAPKTDDAPPPKGK